MPAFTSEALVRLRFHLHDTTLAPPTLVEASVNDAHTLLLRRLATDVNVVTPDADLVIGETLLAGAHLFRSLASNDAFLQKRVTIGGQRLEEGNRFYALLEMADIAERDAWFVLERFVSPSPAKPLLGASDSTPIIGGH